MDNRFEVFKEFHGTPATPSLELLECALRAFIGSEATHPHPDAGLYTEARGLLETLQERGGE